MKCYYTQATSKWARIRKLAQFWAALVSHNLFSNPPKGKSNTIAYNTTTLCTFFLILAQLTLAYYSFVHDGFTLGMLVPNTQETAPIIHNEENASKISIQPTWGSRLMQINFLEAQNFSHIWALKLAQKYIFLRSTSSKNLPLFGIFFHQCVVGNGV